MNKIMLLKYMHLPMIFKKEKPFLTSSTERPRDG